ncbi:MAG TPA: sugar phosphate isomerase/epimerase [Devosia sp.]|nr:sugar phosphate isomerase/epimerase [Devosia sp.]
MDFSIQLYSARNEASLDATLKSLKQLGYTQVEGWGGQFADPAGLAASLKAAGLTMPTAHIGYKQLEDTAAAVNIAKTVGIKTIYCPAPPSDDYRNGTGDWVKLGEGLATIGKALNAGGVGFGYHNHHWEFGKLADGRRPIEILLGSLPSLEWEMDLAWLVKAGEDPVAWMDKLGSRITAVHVKDIAPAGQALDEDGWADVGYGTLDWKSLLQTIKAKTKAKYLVAEHDKPSDAMRFARRSMESVKKWM